jgi:hypothetical protein
MDIDELADIIVAFVRSRSAVKGRALLLGHPELLDPEVDDLFDKLIEAAAYEGETQTIRSLMAIHQIVARARQVGMEAASAHLLELDGPQPP